MSKVIQVRDVPDDVHEALVRQAKAEGLSLTRFVLREYEKIARRARNAEVFERLATLPGPRPTRAQIVTAIREERDRDQ